MSHELASAENPSHPDLLDDFRFFAIVGTWMEEDVIEATVKNAFAQGCEDVYLVDNASTDETVLRAMHNGATLARTYATEQYDEAFRLRLMNDVVAEVSSQCDAEHIWWLFLDADEFPHGPSGMTLRAYLQTLDRKFRVVGTRFFDHYPDAEPFYREGRHPLDFQQYCEELAYPMCPRRHRKHSLQRYDRSSPAITCGPGFHMAYSEEQLWEPALPAFVHHFPFRRKEATQARLDALWRKDDKGASRAPDALSTMHMLTRMRSIEAVYSQQWDRVENFIALDPAYPTLDWAPPRFGVKLRRWSEQVEPEHVHVLRWYTHSDGGFAT